MSVIVTLREKLYNCSEIHDFESAELYVEGLDNWAVAELYDRMDTLFFSLDLNKLSPRIATMIIDKTYQWRHKLAMRKGFIESCKSHYPNFGIA